MESASLLARLIASGAAATRADLVRQTGLARSTIGSGLDALHRAGLIRVDGVQDRTGRGRPGDRLTIDPGFGLIASIEMDLESATVALFDFGQRRQARFTVPIALTVRPAEVVRVLAAEIRTQLAELGGTRILRTAAVAVAAPVDLRKGMMVGPSFLADWDGFPIEAAFVDALGCPVVLGNEVALRALGEARTTMSTDASLVYIRIAEGIGAGYVDSNSTMVTGADGAAGEISHMRSVGTEGRVCLCGGTDHLLSYATARSMTTEWQASAPGRADDSISDFERALRLHDLDATGIAIRAAREIGAALVEIILFLNPEHVVIGGRLLDSSDVILSTIRAVVYDTGLPLATRKLQIIRSELGEDAGIQGGLLLALETSLSSGQISRSLDGVDRSAGTRR